MIKRDGVEVITRAISAGVLNVVKVTYSSQKKIRNDAIHIWNFAPVAIKNCSSKYGTKKAIKDFVSSLPI